MTSDSLVLRSLKQKLLQRLQLNQKLLQTWKNHHKAKTPSLPDAACPSYTGRSASASLKPLSISGQSTVTLLGKLLDANAVTFDDENFHHSEAILLQMSTFTFQTDNKFVSLPYYSKDAHRILLYGEGSHDYLTALLGKVEGMAVPEGPLSLTSADIEAKNVMVWIRGSLGLHSSYVAKYKKKVCEPCIHVNHPYDKLLVISSDG